MTQEKWRAVLAGDQAKRACKEKVSRMFGRSVWQWKAGDYNEKQAINDLLADEGHPPMFADTDMPHAYKKAVAARDRAAKKGAAAIERALERSGGGEPSGG